MIYFLLFNENYSNLLLGTFELNPIKACYKANEAKCWKFFDYYSFDSDIHLTNCNLIATNLFIKKLRSSVIKILEGFLWDIPSQKICYFSLKSI